MARAVGDLVSKRLIPLFYRLYIGLVFLTSKRIYIGFEDLLERLKKGKAIVAIPHQFILLAPYIYREKGVITMASRSKDGEIIARTLEALGFEVVRGSSSRGGSRALLSMVKRLKGEDVKVAALTVDGPRGPKGKVKPGVAFLARKTGLPLYPVTCEARRKILLKNWDRTLIPLPFNHLTFRCGTPLMVGEDLDDRRACYELEERLKALEGRG